MRSRLTSRSGSRRSNASSAFASRCADPEAVLCTALSRLGDVMAHSQNGYAGGESAERAAVARTTASLLSAVNAADLAGVVAVWSDDGVLMPPHHPSVHGRPAIERYFSELFERTRFTFSFTATTLHISGGTAFERIEYGVGPSRPRWNRSLGRGQGASCLSARAERVVEADHGHLEQRHAGTELGHLGSPCESVWVRSPPPAPYPLMTTHRRARAVYLSRRE